MVSFHAKVRHLLGHISRHGRCFSPAGFKYSPHIKRKWATTSPQVARRETCHLPGSRATTLNYNRHGLWRMRSIHGRIQRSDLGCWNHWDWAQLLVLNTLAVCTMDDEVRGLCQSHDVDSNGHMNSLWRFSVELLATTMNISMSFQLPVVLRIPPNLVWSWNNHQYVLPVCMHLDLSE